MPCVWNAIPTRDTTRSTAADSGTAFSTATGSAATYSAAARFAAIHTVDTFCSVGRFHGKSGSETDRAAGCYSDDGRLRFDGPRGAGRDCALILEDAHQRAIGHADGGIGRAESH